MIRVPRGLLSKEQTYHVAVSMGTDSLAALFWMVCEGFNVKPIHVNHSLRPQNDEMQDAFIRMCDAWGLDGVTETVSCDGSEGGCREKRIEVFSRVADGGTVITAHHLNDWVESYLMNCLRGKPHARPFEVTTDFGGFSIMHPFLLTKKLDFVQYLDRNGMLKFFVEDETNQTTKGSRRNWVRNELISILKTQEISLDKYAKRCIGDLYDEHMKNQEV